MTVLPAFEQAGQSFLYYKWNDLFSGLAIEIGKRATSC